MISLLTAYVLAGNEAEWYWWAFWVMFAFMEFLNFVKREA